MNYHQARQVDPASDREDAGKWRYTNMNDGRVWPEGACATDCPGHDTAEEACQHWVEGQVANGVRWHDCSWTTCDNRHGTDENDKPITCPNPAQRLAYVGSADNHGYTLCADHASDNVAEALFRLDHKGEFSSFGSF